MKKLYVINHKYVYNYLCVCVCVVTIMEGMNLVDTALCFITNLIRSTVLNRANRIDEINEKHTYSSVLCLIANQPHPFLR